LPRFSNGFHTLIVLSAEAETNFWFGNVTNESTSPVCPFKVRLQNFPEMSHILIVSSELPDAMCLEPTWATLKTMPWWPVKVAVQRLELALQTRTVPSSPPETTLPSGNAITQATPERWPL